MEPTETTELLREEECNMRSSVNDKTDPKPDLMDVNEKYVTVASV